MDVDGFLQWATLRGIELLLSVEVRASELGGLGIFAKSTPAKNTLGQDTVVLRVPQSSVLGLRNLLQVAEKVKACDPLAARVLNATLHAGGHASETVIIRSFVWALFMRLAQGATDAAGIDAYIRVLATTPTLDIDERAETRDATIRALVAEKKHVRQDYLRLAGALPEAETLMTFAQAFQLHQAVKSRVLEIPQAERGLDAYDYSTSISLVPMLDFANHDHAPNAVFDADPQTGDVVLRLVDTVALGSEITISYDPVNAVAPFLQTYGFVPPAPATLALPIGAWHAVLAEACGHEHAARIAKWLQVPPEITVDVSEAGTVSINAAAFRLPLLAIPGLTYYAAWASEEADIAREFDAPADETGAIVAELQQQETHAAVVQAADTVFGVTWHDSYISLSCILEQTGCNNAQAILALAARTAELVGHMASGPRPGVCAPKEDLGADGGALRQYCALRDRAYKQLLEMPKEAVMSAARESLENLLD